MGQAPPYEARRLNSFPRWYILVALLCNRSAAIWCWWFGVMPAVGDSFFSVSARMVRAKCEAPVAISTLVASLPIIIFEVGT